MSSTLFRIEILQPGFDNVYEEYSKLFEESDMKDGSSSMSSETDFLHIHPEIVQKCKSLYLSGAYAEAVEKSFKVVKDKLRSLTGYEKGSEAFGKGKLHIKGAAAANVDADFNQAAQFLMMAIDMFKNEKGHTSDAKIEDPIRAYQYLAMSSLALSLLGDSNIRS